MFLNTSGGNCPVSSRFWAWLQVVILKNEDTAKSDFFCDFFAFLKGGGANATLLYEMCASFKEG